VRYRRLDVVLVALLVVAFAAGCGSTATIQRGDVQEDPARLAIVAEHEALASQQRQELSTKQEEEMQNALSVINNEEEDKISQLKEQLASDLETASEDARATLAEDELDARIEELETESQTSLQEQTAEIRTAYEEKRTERQAEYTQLHEQEAQKLESSLQTQLQDKLTEYDMQQAQLAAETPAVQPETAAPVQPQPVAQPQPAAEPQPAPQPVAPQSQPVAQPVPQPVPAVVTSAPGTRAPVDPVSSMEEPRLTDKGLRQEGPAPLGQRRHYVNKYFRSGEVLGEITPSEELQKRERHEAVVTFWLEGSGKSASPRFMVNGVPVASWQELESRLAEFRLKLIKEKHLLYAKVILDQRKDVSRSIVDDILSICFRAGIRDISMGGKEPRMEE